MLFYLAREILCGKSLLRSLMNRELERFVLAGKVLDIGGGEDPSYYRFFKKSEDAEIISLDLFAPEASGRRIDLERDALPFPDGSADCVLLFNILEHIYNYRLVLSEARRVLADGGSVLGFAPFLLNVHPDPHDYFRYTKEALENIFREAGFGEARIKEIGGGPFAAQLNIITTTCPRLMSILLLPWYWACDILFLSFRPQARERYPLGYLFCLRQ